MLICTRKGELHSDPNFGCAIWDLQFEQIIDQRKWEKQVKKSIKEGVERYEKRISEVQVSITLTEVEYIYPFKLYPEIKKQAQIQVCGNLVHSGEPYKFSTKLYVSPLSD